MKQRQRIPDPLLMLVSIVGIAAFLIYWLKENYDREKNTLTIRAEISFQKVIEELQLGKMNGLVSDSLHTKKINFVDSGTATKRFMLDFQKKKQLISTINIIENKFRDSLKKDSSAKARMFITVDDTDDSSKFDKKIPPHNHDHVLKLLFRIDSLQAPLKLSEIDSSYQATLKKEKINVPFSVIALDSNHVSAASSNEVTIGFAKPTTYKLLLGNTAPFLLKKIALPIIFSLLLLCITIIAFVVLYKNLLRQKALGEQKNEFISNITHELKTPVATVAVAIEALKNFNAMDDPLRTKEYLDISSNELQRLNLLVDKVLKLSMFENKEVELKYESIDLEQIVNEVVSSLKLQFEKQAAKVTVTSKGNLHLQGDHFNLQAVVFNLLDNALKYGEKTPVINITLEEKESNVELGIADNGIGIPYEYKEKVFEKFFRIPHGDTHNAKGYGLGLSFTAQVIKKHHGTISLESEPNVGTKFFISIPKQPS